MFHLVKNVYLRYEEHLDYQEDCLYLSKHDNYQFNENLARLLTSAFGENYPKMYGHSNSIEDLMSENGGERAFFNMLITHKGYLSNGKLYIFCDPYNFKSFVIRWWKTLLPNLKVDDAYKLFKTYKNRAIYANREQNILLDDSEEYHSKYWGMDEESFKFIFNDSKPFNIDKVVKEHASLEYHLATYYCEGLSKPFARKVRRFYRRQLIDEIAETKKDLERRLYFISSLVSDTDVNFTDPNIDKIKEAYPVFGDSNIRQTLDSFYHLKNNYDILDVVEKMLSAHLDLMLFHDRKELDPASIFAMQLYSDCKKEPSVQQILDEENKNSYYISIFFKMADHNKANLFLLQEIFYLREQGKIEELRRYSL